MKRCIKCILPVTFPSLTLDTDGICSICSGFSHTDFIPSLIPLRDKLLKLFSECKSQKNKYDAVVAYSGGKDSTYLVHILKKTYGLNVLAITFDNGFMSEYSFSNMRNVLEQIGVDHVIYKPEYALMQAIFRESSGAGIYPEYLTKFGSGICISCIRMVTVMATRAAIEKRIPLVMLGNSPGQLIQSENEIMYKDNKIPYGLRRNLFRPLAERVSEEVYHYLMLNKEEYRAVPFPTTVNAFPLIGYDEDLIYRTIKSMGWKKPEDVDPNSTNCRLNSLGIIKHKELYNFHPYDYEMSMLVRLGVISRDEAMKRVEDPQNRAAQLSTIVEKQLNKNSEVVLL